MVVVRMVVLVCTPVVDWLAKLPESFFVVKFVILSVGLINELLTLARVSYPIT